MELLKDSAKRTTSVQWPQAIDDRLQVLVAMAAAAGEPVSRAQLLAALVAGVPMEAEHIGAVVRSYHRQRPEEFREATGTAGELQTIRPPGPKRRPYDAPPA
jgi:hypothetical protein